LASNIKIFEFLHSNRKRLLRNFFFFFLKKEREVGIKQKVWKKEKSMLSWKFCSDRILNWNSSGDEWNWYYWMKDLWFFKEIFCGSMHTNTFMWIGTFSKTQITSNTLIMNSYRQQIY
jgi:hypothetical protein